MQCVYKGVEPARLCTNSPVLLSQKFRFREVLKWLALSIRVWGESLLRYTSYYIQYFLTPHKSPPIIKLFSCNMKTIMSPTFHDYKTYSKVNQQELFLACSHASIFILLIQNYPLHIQDKKRLFWVNSSRCILFYCKIILFQFRFSMWKIVLLKDLVYGNICLRCLNASNIWRM